ncbi:hypothetical protein P2318_34570 [Myxococcaceae bacterium GXIMD 01537]
METSTPWSPAHGLLYGVAAGGVFALAELVAAAAGGEGLSVMEPFRMAASVALGQRAFTGAVSPGVVVLVGLGVHLGMTAFWGLLYSFIDSRLPPDVRPSSAFQAASGMLFALFVWLLDFQFVARGYFPWFLERTPQFFQALMHALFYGLPLGLLFSAAERRRVALDIERGRVL